MSAKALNRPFSYVLMLFCLTVFQVFSFIPVLFNENGELSMTVATCAVGFISLEWLYLLMARLITSRSDFALEIIAFFLSGIGMVICASIHENYAVKQLVAVAIGVVCFAIISAIMRSIDTAMLLRTPMAVGAVALLVLNLVLAKTTNGALNWITIGSFSLQPSELVKVAFVFVGAATLEKLQATRSLTKYIIFSVGCIGALFLMRDFGTALIFFFTFIVIAFMRSGDIRSIFLICTAALLGAILIIYFKPYVANRFATYRHIWDFANEGGFQQTRVLIYSSSGGLLGLGIGNGKLRNVFAASTDLVFGMICEEWGILLAFLIILAFATVAVYAVKGARKSSSVFYSIASVAAASLLLFQLALNVFGITDLLPLTGVTLPFVSRGGSSMISSWALFALIKSVNFNIGDINPYRRKKSKSNHKGVVV